MNEADAARWIVGAAIAITAVEAIVLATRPRMWRALGGRRAALANVGAGLCLQLALFAALAGATVPIALGLLGAGACHALDVAWRIAAARRSGT